MDYIFIIASLIVMFTIGYIVYDTMKHFDKKSVNH